MTRLRNFAYLHIWHKITNWFYFNVRPLKPIIGLENLENLHIIFCIFAYFHIFCYIFAYLYIFRIYFCIFRSFTVYNFIKLYTADTDWRFNISSRCFLFCATAEYKDTHSILWTLSKICYFCQQYLPIPIILRTLCNRNFIFSKLPTKICHNLL